MKTPALCGDGFAYVDSTKDCEKNILCMFKLP